MKAATAAPRTTTGADQRPAFRSAEELREVLDRVLGLVDADERRGPLLRATRIRLRLDLVDLDLALRLQAVDDDPDRCIEWWYSERSGWQPRFSLRMDSTFANAYLQGAESLPVALARGRVQCSGNSRAALAYLPAIRLITGTYKSLVRDEYPRLALG